MGSTAGDENVERGNWTCKLDFILSAIGFSVGFGNVWRFPYIAYANGGACFLIPYLVMLLTAGIPLFFLEMAVGQFSSLGPISVWRAVPMFKGIGWAMVVISGLVCVYYNVIIAYTLYYVFASFTSELPWQKCKQSWIENYHCVDMDDRYINYSIALKAFCNEIETMYGKSALTQNCTTSPKSPSEIYWNREVLDISGNIDEGAGDIKWDLCLCLLLAWIIVFVCLVKGIKSSGKVVYVTATFPHIVLLILLIRNATLEGAWDGIVFYIFPEYEKLKNPKVWYEAAVQIFYSLGVAFGGLETMASYNKFRNNIFMDALIVSFLNCATSVFAGFVIFSVLGHMAFKTGLPVSHVAESGFGLAFIAYPEGIATMPVAPLWSILFFLMLFTLGLDSQFAMMETVITAIYDEFNFAKKGKYAKLILTASICIFLFLVALPQVSRAGPFILNLFDWYSAGFSLVVVSILEVVAIAWIYGVRRFTDDIQMMLGESCMWPFIRITFYVYWWPMWCLISPAMMIFVIVYMGMSYVKLSLNGIYQPWWADVIGWLMVSLALMFIPLVALINYCKAHDFFTGCFQTLPKILLPTKEWGPALESYRTGRYEDAVPTTLNGNYPGAKKSYQNGGYDAGADEIKTQIED